MHCAGQWPTHQFVSPVGCHARGRWGRSSVEPDEFQRVKEMLIIIVGRGPLAKPIAGSAKRAGHVLRRSEQAPATPPIDESFGLAILVGSRSSVEADLANVAAERLQGLVVVDAIVPTQDTRDDSSRETVWSSEAESAWIAKMF